MLVTSTMHAFFAEMSNLYKWLVPLANATAAKYRGQWRCRFAKTVSNRITFTRTGVRYAQTASRQYLRNLIMLTMRSPKNCAHTFARQWASLYHTWEIRKRSDCNVWSALLWKFQRRNSAHRANSQCAPTFSTKAKTGAILASKWLDHTLRKWQLRWEVMDVL